MSTYRLSFVFFLILVGLSSCRPRNVLSRSEMTDVLYDLHMTEALTEGSEWQVPNDWMKGMNPYDFRDMAYQSVLKKHKLDQETFYASVDYYSKHLPVYIKIYSDVDKKMAEYIKGIEEGQFSTETRANALAHIRIDTVKTRAWFDFVLKKSPEKITTPLYFTPDSVKTYLAVQASQWIHTSRMDTISLLVGKPQPVQADTAVVQDTVQALSSTMLVDSLRRVQQHPQAGAMVRKQHVGSRSVQKTANGTPIRLR